MYFFLQFDKNGYVVINNFLSEKETKDLKDAGEKLTENVPADVKTVFVASNTKHVIIDFRFFITELDLQVLIPFQLY